MKKSIAMVTKLQCLLSASLSRVEKLTAELVCLHSSTEVQLSALEAVFGENNVSLLIYTADLIHRPAELKALQASRGVPGFRRDQFVLQGLQGPHIFLI